MASPNSWHPLWWVAGETIGPGKPIPIGLAYPPEQVRFLGRVKHTLAVAEITGGHNEWRTGGCLIKASTFGCIRKFVDRIGLWVSLSMAQRSANHGGKGLQGRVV